MMLQKSFGRYVSPEVLDMILVHPEDSWLKGTRNDATVLFTDVRWFTAYLENRKPEEVVEDLNEYFGIATARRDYIQRFLADRVGIKLPEPVRKIIGDLSNTEKVLVGLDLRERV